MKGIIYLIRKYRKYILWSIDMLCVALAYLFCFNFVRHISGTHLLAGLAALMVCYLVSFKIFGIQRIIWRYSTPSSYAVCAEATVVAEAVFLAVSLVMSLFDEAIHVNVAVHIVRAGLTLLLFWVMRIGYTCLFSAVRGKRAKDKQAQTDNRRRLMIVGAGKGADFFIKELPKSQDGYLPICAVDDDPAKIGRKIDSISVEGNTAQIPQLCEKFHIDVIAFCIPSIDAEGKSRILNLCLETGCRVLKMPDLMSFAYKNGGTPRLQKIKIEDLLSRPPVSFQNSKAHDFINGKTVMVTGAGGSIGSELCRQIAALGPRRLIMLDIYENTTYDVQQELVRKYGSDLNLTVVISSVRDAEKVGAVMNEYRPQIVYHAAAHKHVPLMENNCEEAVKNNVFGTLNVGLAAIEYGVERFILVSTDKAVNPTNVMGATKRLCEMIVQCLNGRGSTCFAAVRFGNVLGSHGSVIPLFERQIAEGGPITVTHPDIVRYFMTIPEAVSLLLLAGAMAKNGEIFILDMGKPVKILDLANKMLALSGLEAGRDIEIKFVGLRPGEKLYEELLLAEEGITQTEDSRIFIGNQLEVDGDVLMSELDELRVAAMNNDSEYCKTLLERMVPTYVPQNSEKAHASRADAEIVAVVQ